MSLAHFSAACRTLPQIEAGSDLSGGWRLKWLAPMPPTVAPPKGSAPPPSFPLLGPGGSEAGGGPPPPSQPPPSVAGSSAAGSKRSGKSVMGDIDQPAKAMKTSGLPSELDGLSHEEKLHLWSALSCDLGASADMISRVLRVLHHAQQKLSSTKPVEACLPGTSIRIAPLVVADIELMQERYVVLFLTEEDASVGEYLAAGAKESEI